MNNFFSLLILIPCFAFSQQKQTSQISWHLIVVDSLSGKGIGKATISINKRRYFSTNYNGEIDIDRDVIIRNDSIKISCVGYKPVLLTPVGTSKLPNLIKLSTSIKTLREIKISDHEKTPIILGVVKKYYNSHRVTSPDIEYVVYIPNEKKFKGTITSIEYVINDKLNGIERPFKVGLYTKSKGNPFPDLELIKDTIIVQNPEKKHRVSVDISKYNIQMPEDGLMVAFETLSAVNYGKDSTWNKGEKMAKVPGIDMDLKIKEEYDVDVKNKDDRKAQYSMVIYVNDKWNFEELKYHSYLYSEGNNFAITITVSPD